MWVDHRYKESEQNQVKIERILALLIGHGQWSGSRCGLYATSKGFETSPLPKRQEIISDKGIMSKHDGKSAIMQAIKESTSHFQMPFFFFFIFY